MDFKFKFKTPLTAIVKEREWEVTAVKSGRKEKLCAVCNKIIPIGNSAVTFTKRDNIAATQKIQSLYTCTGNCAAIQMDKLGIDL